MKSLVSLVAFFIFCFNPPAFAQAKVYKPKHFTQYAFNKLTSEGSAEGLSIIVNEQQKKISVLAPSADQADNTFMIKAYGISKSVKNLIIYDCFIPYENSSIRYVILHNSFYKTFRMMPIKSYQQGSTDYVEYQYR